MKQISVIFSITWLGLFACELFAQNLQQGQTAFEQNKYADAKKILTAIDDDHKDYAQAQFILGQIAFTEKKYDDASEFFEEAIDANDKVAQYHYWLGAAYGQEAKSANMLKQGLLAPKIKSAFEKCVALDGKHKDGLTGLVQYYLQAPSFMGGDKDKALVFAKKLKAIDPLEGTILLGQAYEKIGKDTDAEKEYLELVKNQPNEITPLVVLGNYYIGKKKYQQALDLYENSLKQKPNNMLLTYQIGKTAAIAGLALERGEACLQSYLKHKPTPEEPSIEGANFRLGMIYEKKNNKPEAKKYYETALKLDPKMEDAKEGLKRVGK